MSRQAGDRELRCADCGDIFTWSVEDQAFFKEKGYAPPKRCESCQQAQQAKRGGDGESQMGGALLGD